MTLEPMARSTSKVPFCLLFSCCRLRSAANRSVKRRSKEFVSWWFIGVFFLMISAVVGGEPIPACVGGRSVGCDIFVAVDHYLSGSDAKKSAIVTKYGEIEDWDVSQVTHMVQLFMSKKMFNGDLSKWNVGRVVDMSASKYIFSLSQALSSSQHPIYSFMDVYCFSLSLSLLSP